MLVGNFEFNHNHNYDLTAKGDHLGVTQAFNFVTPKRDQSGRALRKFLTLKETGKKKKEKKKKKENLTILSLCIILCFFPVP